MPERYYLPSNDGGVGAEGTGGGSETALPGPEMLRSSGGATVGIGTEGAEVGGSFTEFGAAGGVNIIGVGWLTVVPGAAWPDPETDVPGNR